METGESSSMVRGKEGDQWKEKGKEFGKPYAARTKKYDLEEDHSRDRAASRQNFHLEYRNVSR